VTNLFTTLGIVTGALISLGITLRPVYKKLKEFGEWMDRFKRDWEGTPEEPGRDAVPGIMERMNRMDGELSQNGGFTTVKDRVDRLYENQAKVIETQDKLLEAFVEMGERLINIENCVTDTKTVQEN
jgi:hypothetical protein